MRENGYRCHYETYRIDGQWFWVMPLYSPGGSTLQLGARRDLLSEASLVNTYVILHDHKSLTFDLTSNRPRVHISRLVRLQREAAAFNRKKLTLRDGRRRRLYLSGTYSGINEWGTTWHYSDYTTKNSSVYEIGERNHYDVVVQLYQPYTQFPSNVHWIATFLAHRDLFFILCLLKTPAYLFIETFLVDNTYGSFIKRVQTKFLIEMPKMLGLQRYSNDSLKHHTSSLLSNCLRNDVLANFLLTEHSSKLTS